MDELTVEQAEVKTWLESYGWEDIEFSGDLVRSGDAAVWRLPTLVTYKAGDSSAIVDDEAKNGRPEWPK